MPNRLHLLVVDDDQDFIRDFEIIGREFFRMTSSGSGEEAVQVMKKETPDAVILDLRLGQGMDGLETLRVIRGIHADIPVIMVTQYASVETAVEAMKLGAFHYMSKNPNLKELHAIIMNELRNAVWKSLYLQEIHEKYGELVGESEPMKKLFRQISRLAPSDVNVLIQGENGSGKELVAREIHARSRRSDKPFVVVNCPAIPGPLFESELFGHEKGAFTGAVCRRKGKFELAHTGTLFLDEISAMDPALQAKLLHVTEHQAFERVGGTEPIPMDIRIISASNRDLLQDIPCGKFREDLFYRLNVMNLSVPPLRERKEDVPLLAAYFCRKLFLKWGRPCQDFSPGAMEKLKSYHWPGNVRELRNIIERTLILVTDRMIEPEDLELGAHDAPNLFDDGKNRFLPYEKARNRVMNQFKKKYLLELLERCGGNVSRAAREAGLSRPGLHRMMKEVKMTQNHDQNENDGIAGESERISPDKR